MGLDRVDGAAVGDKGYSETITRRATGTRQWDNWGRESLERLRKWWSAALGAEI